MVNVDKRNVTISSTSTLAEHREAACATCPDVPELTRHLLYIFHFGGNGEFSESE
jgi:hypothetical protein